MLSVQNNFAYTIGTTPPPQQAVAFATPNSAGNGLIVIAYFLCALPCRNPNLEISDSRSNSYQAAGGCGIYDGSNWTSLLKAWYVQSCAGGSNTVTVTETVDTDSGTTVLAVSVFEYSGSFGTLDASAFAVGLALKTMTMNVMTTAVDLLFAYGVNYAVRPTISLDSNSLGWTQEQSESIENTIVPTYTIVAPLGVDKVADAGPQSITMDVTQQSGGMDLALLIALPVGWTPPPAPSPSPAPPASGSSVSWPTIF